MDALVQEIALLAIAFLVFDYFYLSNVAGIFDSVVKAIQGSGLNLKILGAIGAYAAIVYQFYHFIVAKEGTKMIDAFILGLTTYAIYDFTNYALFDKYPLDIGLMDTLWGGVLYSLVFWVFQSYK
jgi:uncharacterized membrane protein